MRHKAAGRITEKDIDKLQTEYAKHELYKYGMGRQQKKIIEVCEKKLEVIKNKIEELKVKLEPYTNGKTNGNPKVFLHLKKDYERSLASRDTLQKAILAATESLGEAENQYIPGDGES